MEIEKNLKEKVLQACESIEKTGKKITCDQVREQTGGSDRDLSQYIKEWKAAKEKALTVSINGANSQQNQKLVAISDESVPNSVPIQPSISNADIKQIQLYTGKVTTQRKLQIVYNPKRNEVCNVI